MKKRFLAILVLGLLFSGNINAATVSDYVFEGMSKKQLKKLTDPKGFSIRLYETEELEIGGYYGEGGTIAGAMCNGYDHKVNKNEHKYFSKYKTEIFTHPAFLTRDHMGNSKESLRMLKILPGTPWYIFENVTEPIKCKYLRIKVGNGTLKAIAWSKEEAYAIANPEFKKKYSNKKFPTREEQLEIAKKNAEKISKKIIADNPVKPKPSQPELSSADKIAQAKQVCKELGFKPKSEKFADCALKMVMLDFERTTTAKNEPQVVIHKNVSNTNIFDELGVLFRQQGIIQDTSRPANNRTNMRCTSSKTGFGQVVTNCR